MIGIIAAMQEELDEIIKLMQGVSEISIGNTDYSFTKGIIENRECVAVLGRVAKVNATISTMLLLNNFDIDVVIDVGSAGGLKDSMKLLDVVISTATAQHDLDVGRLKGELGNQPRFIECKKELVELASEALKADLLDGASIYTGLIVSGDQFVLTNQAGAISEAFPEAQCVEMEGAAINFACYKLNVPCIIIRSISDTPHNDENNGLTFDEYLPLAAINAAKVCNALIKRI